MTDQTVNVLSVEDNLLVSDAIERRLVGDPRFCYLGAVSTLPDLRARALGGPPMVVCMDLNIPGEDTLAMVRMLRTEVPQARVLILSGWLGREAVRAAVDAGAWGFVSKADDSREIVEALLDVAQGRFVLGPTIRALCESKPIARSEPAASETESAGKVSVRRGIISKLFGASHED